MGASESHWRNRAAAIAAALLFHPAATVLFAVTLPYALLPSVFHVPVLFLNTFSIFLSVFWLAAILGGFIFSIVRLTKKQTDNAFVTGVACLLISLTGIPFLMYGKGVNEKPGVLKIQKRGEAIIAALERFHQKYDCYPDSLDVLVPEYLPEIPSTGAVGFPEFKYSRDYHPPEVELKNHYALVVNTGMGLFNYDYILYNPSHSYPEQSLGGSVERFGDWAYIHE